MFYFVFNIEEPNYFLCNEIIFYEIQLQGNTVNFSYPKSCDQEFYHEGFTDFKNVFSETFNYQSRPLSILSVNLLYEIINIFGINSTTNALISTFLVQNFIVLIVVTLLENILYIKKQQTSNSYILLSLIVLISPLFKWGIFDPSHQLLTMLVIIFYPLYSSDCSQILKFRCYSCVCRVHSNFNLVRIKSRNVINVKFKFSIHISITNLRIV